MKKILTLLLLVVVAITVNAQTPPEAFNYSAVARDANSNPIANSTIGIQISIKVGSPLGATVYQENHFVNTDDFGLFNLIVGSGSIQSGTIADIDWSLDDYYLQVGMDANGGTNFLNMGSTQLLSVPYALYAKSAGSVSGGGSGTFTHYIGEEFGGGVIFHLWLDANGVEHGLIIDIIDLSASHIWSNVDQTAVGPSAQSSWDGLSNSNAIFGQTGHISSAAALCVISTNAGYSDWYLPSMDEFILIVNNRFAINKGLSTIGGASQLPQLGNYWTSTEYDGQNLAWRLSVNGSGNANAIVKSSTCIVRAVRAF